MPYSSTSELPPDVRKMSPKRQRQWRAVFNSVYAETQSDSRAARAAWSRTGAVSKKEQDLENILAFSAKDVTKAL